MKKASIVALALVLMSLVPAMPAQADCDWRCYMSFDIEYCEGVNAGTGDMWTCDDYLDCYWDPSIPGWWCTWRCRGQYCW